MAREDQSNSQSSFRRYSALLIIAAVVGLLANARTTGVLACQAPDNSDSEYLAYCNVTNFGDYDHGAFWYGLEPTASAAAASADVLFVGNSRMQFALSASPVDDWFSQRSLNYYLLGFSHNESHVFFSPLLKRLQPRAKMFVLNVDDLFADKLTAPAKAVMEEPESLNRYTQKQRWQTFQRAACGALPQLCGNRMSFIRDRASGAWTFKGRDFLDEEPSKATDVSYDRGVDADTVEQFADRAREFLADLDAGPGCVVLMNTPGSGASAGTVAAVAAELNMVLVAPELGDLRTFDGSHLDTDSAEQWSQQFMMRLEPLVHGCLG